MADDAAQKSALADYIKALEVLADSDDPNTAPVLFLMLWEQFGPEVSKAAADEGYECPVEWAEDHIISAEKGRVEQELGPGVHVLDDDEAGAFDEEREGAVLN